MHVFLSQLPTPSPTDIGTWFVIAVAVVSSYQAVSKLLNKPPPKNPELITRTEFFHELQQINTRIDTRLDSIATTLADLNATVARIDERTKK